MSDYQDAKWPLRRLEPLDANSPIQSNTAGNNVLSATSQTAVDRLNASFYGQIQYPPPPFALERVVEQGFWSKMLAHDIGSWNCPIINDGSQIWVPGCGSNQALITALKFPEAQVLGSDLSEQSLATCSRNAMQIGISNLRLECESINTVDYANRFDYVLCTGVIHHNADPEVALKRLATSLTNGGVLELMVYNQYHRITSAAFQTAVRTLLGNSLTPDLQQEAATADKLVQTFDEPGAMQSFLAKFRQIRFPEFADALLQPVEHSFSVASLSQMATRCGLELLAFAVDQFSQRNNAINWNMLFKDQQLQTIYDGLPDADRWQITNCLLLDKSPMLWFYLQRKDSNRKRKSERQMCEEFLTLPFRRNRTYREMFLRLEDGTYSNAPTRVSFPPPAPKHPSAARVCDSIREDTPISEAIKKVGLKTSFETIHPIRVHLASSAFPFISCQLV